MEYDLTWRVDRENPQTRIFHQHIHVRASRSRSGYTRVMEENKKKRVLVLCAEDSNLCEKAMQYTSCNVYKPGDEVHVVSPEVADQQVQGDKRLKTGPTEQD